MEISRLLFERASYQFSALLAHTESQCHMRLVLPTQLTPRRGNCVLAAAAALHVFERDRMADHSILHLQNS
jgi:hypothetical protein